LELHVWSIDLSRGSPPQRRDVANAALRQILASHLGKDPERIELASGEHGKPRLAGGELEFNLSHSGEIALVAVNAEHQVGIDVERVKPDRDPLALAQRALVPDDVRAVREASPEERGLVFHRRWTRHEARLKCLGVGIFQEAPPGIGTVSVRDLEMAPGYAAAVAIAADELPPLRCWTFDPPLQKDGDRVS
jgi:4'-phosphopantetheinyl transferase